MPSGSCSRARVVGPTCLPHCRCISPSALWVNRRTSQISPQPTYASTARHLGGALFCVDGVTTTTESHFPERDLARWLATIRGDQTPIYAIERGGPVTVLDAYRRMLSIVGPIDLLVLVDGGTDILMRGDEVGLGTPDGLDGVARITVACIGFGVDASTACAIAGGFLGVFGLTAASEEARAYADASRTCRAHDRDSRAS